MLLIGDEFPLFLIFQSTIYAEEPAEDISY
jgi:hypothetical protein